MKEDTETSTFALLAGDGGFDPLEDGVRQRVRIFIKTILEEELQAALGRGRYERSAGGARGHRNGHRERQIIGTFGAETVKVPRARLVDDRGETSEWRSQALRRYQRLTRKAEALIAAVYLAEMYSVAMLALSLFVVATPLRPRRGSCLERGGNWRAA